MDEGTITALRRLAPDLMEALLSRAEVLMRVKSLQPVGRRALSQKLHLPEREVRSICESLREAGLLEMRSSGMVLTADAEDTAQEAAELSRRLRGVHALEAELMHALSIHQVRIVSGDADQDEAVLWEAGRVAAAHLEHLLTEDTLLTVSGGTTVKAVADALSPRKLPHVRVLPARGGVGLAVETQASTLAAEFAHALGCSHALLHLPDAIGPDALKELIKLPEIADALSALNHTDVLLYGVARADVMVKNRRMSEEEARSVMERGAVAEAAGSYFDRDGNLLYQVSSIGLTEEQLTRVRVSFAVACGASKAEAILAVMRHHRHELLVTDWGAAMAIRKILQSEAK